MKAIGCVEDFNSCIKRVIITKDEIDAAIAEMDEAVKFADESEYPDPATVLDDMYAIDNERCVAR